MVCYPNLQTSKIRGLSNSYEYSLQSSDVAQVHQYGALSENRTHNQWFAILAYEPLKHMTCPKTNIVIYKAQVWHKASSMGP